MFHFYVLPTASCKPCATRGYPGAHRIGLHREGKRVPKGTFMALLLISPSYALV